MKPRISIITLAVRDLEASLKFYRDGLGLATEGIMGTEFEDGAVVFFELEGGLKLAIWPQESLAHDTLCQLHRQRLALAFPPFQLVTMLAPKRRWMH